MGFLSNTNNYTMRYFPNYVLYKEVSFSLKFVPPQFKRNNQNVNVGKKGKIVFEIAPRNSEGTSTDWFNAISIALTVEEIGELLSNLGKCKESTYSHTSMNGDTKTLTVIPSEDGVSCKLHLHSEVSN